MRSVPAEVYQLGSDSLGNLPTPVSQLSIIENEVAKKRVERLVRVLEYCDQTRSRNEIVAFAKRERLGAKATVVADLKYLLAKTWLSRTKQQRPGMPDSYRTSASGRHEAESWHKMKIGVYKEQIPVGPIEITYKFPKDGPGSLLGEALRDIQLKVLNDPKRREELFTLVGSILAVHSQRDKDDLTTFDGKFLSDGRFLMALMFSREDSIRLRKMSESGRFEEGRVEVQLAELISIMGLRALYEVYSEHQRTGFEPGSITVCILPFALDKEGKFEHRIANVKDMPKKIREAVAIRESTGDA